VQKEQISQSSYCPPRLGIPMAGMPVGNSGMPEGMAGKPAGISGIPEGMAGIPEGMAPKRLPNPPLLLPPSEPESLLSDPLPAPEIWNIDVSFFSASVATLDHLPPAACICSMSPCIWLMNPPMSGIPEPPAADALSPSSREN
jgi:hypothetical protein